MEILFKRGDRRASREASGGSAGYYKPRTCHSTARRLVASFVLPTAKLVLQPNARQRWVGTRHAGCSRTLVIKNDCCEPIRNAYEKKVSALFRFLGLWDRRGSLFCTFLYFVYGIYVRNNKRFSLNYTLQKILQVEILPLISGRNKKKIGFVSITSLIRKTGNNYTPPSETYQYLKIIINVFGIYTYRWKQISAESRIWRWLILL